ncbi:MAG: MbcA/ParS/Xre antitoxin family protein [Pseudomonadota bacterium]
MDALEIKSARPNAILGDGYSERELHAMQRAVINLFAKWKVSDIDAAVILGGIAAKTFRRWKDGDYGRVNRDLADRMSNLLGIHKALRIIFSDASRGYEWIRAENKAFAQNSALDILKRGGMQDILRIRHYLDSTRGGW